MTIRLVHLAYLAYLVHVEQKWRSAVAAAKKREGGNQWGVGRMSEFSTRREGLDDTMARAITLIRSASLSDIAEYAYAATAPAESRLIFLAGACPLNDDGSTAAIGDYAGQARKAVENMQVALAASGASLQDVISTRVLVASSRREDLVTAWQVVRDSFADHDVPSTLMGVTVLGYEDQLVEIEAVAAVLDS